MVKVSVHLEKNGLNNFKILTKLKLTYVYQTIFQVLRVAHLAAKLGFQKVKKCLIEGAIFLKFWPIHCFKGIKTWINMG